MLDNQSTFLNLKWPELKCIIHMFREISGGDHHLITNNLLGVIVSRSF